MKLRLGLQVLPWGPAAMMAGPPGAGSDSRPLSQQLGPAPWEESTNDISHYLGMLDPWYERNVLGLMHLPPEVLCQVRGPRGEGTGPTGCGHQPHLEDQGTSREDR